MKALEVKNDLEPSQDALLLALAYRALLLLSALTLNTGFSQGTGVEVLPSQVPGHCREGSSGWSFSSSSNYFPSAAAPEGEVSFDIVIVLGVPGCRWQFGCHAQIMCPVVQTEVSAVAQSP